MASSGQRVPRRSPRSGGARATALAAAPVASSAGAVVLVSAFMLVSTIMLMLALILAPALSMAHPARGSGEPYRLATSWGGNGTAAGQLSDPQGVTSDTSGNVYVLDEGNNRVQKFTSGGVFIQQWGSKGADLGPLHFWYPYGIACDTVHGYIYVGDTGNSRIVRFDLDGNPVGSPITAHSAPAITSIHGMACDPSGNLYVCERSTDGVVKYDSSGAFQGVINGSGDHVLDKPYGVACDGSGNVFVADTLNNRVVQFSSGGAFVRRWGSYGTGNGGLSYPRGIACDSSGNVYVANFHFPFVCQKFSRSGVWKARWGDSAAEGDLGFPSAVACGAGGAVYVTEIEQDKTFKYVAVNGPTTLALANVSVAQGSKAKFRFRVNDASSASAVVTIKLYKGKVLKKALKVGSKPTNAAQTYRWTCSLSPGSYVWRVYARDAAGYKQVKIGSKKLTVL